MPVRFRPRPPRDGDRFTPLPRKGRSAKSSPSQAETTGRDRVFRSSSVVEQATVNRLAAGSNPASGAIIAYGAFFPERAVAALAGKQHPFCGDEPPEDFSRRTAGVAPAGSVAGSAALQSRSWDLVSKSKERLWRAALPAGTSSEKTGQVLVRTLFDENVSISRLCGAQCQEFPQGIISCPPWEMATAPPKRYGSAGKACEGAHR